MSSPEEYLQESLQEFQKRLHTSLPLRHHREYVDTAKITHVSQLESDVTFRNFKEKISVFKNREKKRELENEFHFEVEKITEAYQNKNEEFRAMAELDLKRRAEDLCEDFKSTSEAHLLLNPDMDMESLEEILENGKEVAMKYFEYHFSLGFVGLYEVWKQKLQKDLDNLEREVVEQRRRHLKPSLKEKAGTSLSMIKQTKCLKMEVSVEVENGMETPHTSQKLMNARNGQWFPDAGDAVDHLQKRIKEREDDGPRLKFINDHQLINDRRTNEPCIPILPGHDQEAWFAKLELNGIWKVVFEYLTNPSDVTSAYFACELFRKHLEEKRKTMMLSKVFGVLRACHYLGWDYKEINRELLKQRLVSKAWKAATEPVRDVRTWYIYGGRPGQCRFASVSDVEFALDHLPHSSTSSCASFLRMVEVKDGGRHDNARFYSKLVEFMDRHGGAIWTLGFVQERNQPSGDFHYESLHNLVSRLPNLKSLYVRDYCTRPFYNEPERERERHRVELNERKERLCASIVRYPFPKRPSLEALYFHSQPDQTAFLLAEILRRSANLKTVILNDLKLEEGWKAMPGFVWEELRHLRLDHFELGYCTMPSSRGFIQDLVRLREVDWPLKCIDLGFDIYEEDEGEDRTYELKASDVFTTLSQFNDTLEDIRVDAYKNDVPLPINDRKGVVVDFPKLKNLELYYSERAIDDDVDAVFEVCIDERGNEEGIDVNADYQE